MIYVHRTLIVAAQDVALARSLSAGLAGEAGEGMYMAALSPTGDGPATHYISSGPIYEEFVALLGDAQATFDAAGGQVPLAAIEGLYARATISEDDPYAVMASLGLTFLTTEEV